MSDIVELNDSTANFSISWPIDDSGRFEVMAMKPKWPSSTAAHNSALSMVAVKSNSVYQDVKVMPCMSDARGSAKVEMQWGGADGIEANIQFFGSGVDKYGNTGAITFEQNINGKGSASISIDRDK